MKLKIGNGLALPLEAATETAAILGRRGSGKTHTAVVMAEEMLQAGVQVIVLDPLDVWWGLRVAKDGKSAGVPIYVCGGSHADVPLTADAGRVLADAVVDRHLSMVLSVRHLSKGDQRRFVADFCERVYERKADPKHRTAMHVFLDEADAFVPQRLVPGSERCFGAVDTMVRRGRSSGLAVTLISQRPQVVNKDVLSQTEVLVAHQLTGPQDRKALQAWIDANATDEAVDQFMASLASLPRGTAWFWSPGLLQVFTRVQVRDRHTFDSSATPKAGVAAVASPKAFAKVDLQALTAEIAATVEKAKADDPRELRKQIAELQKKVDGRIADAMVRAVAEPKVVEKQVLKDGQLARAEKILAAIDKVMARIDDARGWLETNRLELQSSTKDLAAAIGATGAPQQVPSSRSVVAPAAKGAATSGGGAHQLTRPPRARIESPTSNADITPARQRILNALRFFASIGVDAPTRPQLALFVGAPPTSGGYKNNLGAMRSSGLVDYPQPNTVALTDRGLAMASDEGVPTTTAELQATVRGLLTPAQVRILDAVLRHHPAPVDREQLADIVDVPASSGGFKNNLGAMRTLGVLTYPQPAYVAAAPILFLEGR